MMYLDRHWLISTKRIFLITSNNPIICDVSRHGASTCVLVLESTLNTFFGVLGGAFKHLLYISIYACACA